MTGSNRHVGWVATLALLVTFPAHLHAQGARSYTRAELGEVPRAAADEGGPRNWEVVVSGSLNLRASASTSGEVIAEFGAGTILDNLGCETAGGRVWCDVQELGGGPRGWVAAAYLRPALSPDGAAWAGPDHSAYRAGISDFDARGTVPCGPVSAPLTQECGFGVARSGGGYATVSLFPPDDRTRAVYFRMGIAISSDIAEADGDIEYRADRDDDAWMIWIGDRVYQIPHEVVLGG